MADQGSEGLLSPFLRWYRIRAALPHIGGRVLDVGCGSGTLAHYVSPECYLGVDLDECSLSKARQEFPQHSFSSILPDKQQKFDVVAALAVLEHVPAPEEFLKMLSFYLKNSSSIVLITTPHPLGDWIHGAGSSLGLFSSHANEEHQELLDRRRLEILADFTGLRLAHYRRFLVGMNQLVLFKI